MAKEIIQLVTDEELHQLSIAQRLASGEITNEVYSSLSEGEQEQVRDILFAQYSDPVPTPAALSALEFTIFGLAKLFFKAEAGQPLTDSEQEFYERFRQYIEQHEITLDANDWYIPYSEQGMLVAKANRAEYKSKKQEITGSF